MEKIILVPDSFKGTMSSREICLIMEEAVLRHYPNAEIVSLPVADGGEGSVDCFLAAVGGDKVTVPSKGPYFEGIQSCYGLLPDNTAVIEVAACAGLPMVGDNKAAEKTTTYGTGLQIAHALKSGCRRAPLSSAPCPIPACSCCIPRLPACHNQDKYPLSP